MSGTIAKMKQAADAIAKADEGYDQSQRWSCFDGKKVVPHKECDCSTCCGVIAKLGGYDVDLSGTFYTGNFAAKLKAAGFVILRYTSLAAVKAGDFLLKPGKHVEYAYTKDKFFSAHIDERGKASGGKAGDQTGREVGFRAAYDYPGGWEYIVRPPAEVLKVTTPAKPAATPAKPAAFATYKVKITAKSGLIVRKSPSTAAARVSALVSGAVVIVTGKTTGTSVGGNASWLKVTGGYIAEYYTRKV